MSTRKTPRSSHSRAFSANRTRINTAETLRNRENAYPEIKQRGFYSDVITQEANDDGIEVSFALIQFLKVCRHCLVHSQTFERNQHFHSASTSSSTPLNQFSNPHVCSTFLVLLLSKSY